MTQPPVLSFSALRDGEPQALAALSDACECYGLFLLKDHGIDGTLAAGAFTAAADFFARPLPEKNQVRRSAENPWGFYDAELTKNTRDWKEIFDVGPPIDRWVPRWPQQPVAFRPQIDGLAQACYDLSLELLDALAALLSVPSQRLRAGFAPSHTSFLRINRYPRCAEPANPEGLQAPAAGHLGVNHHTDSGALTILLQDGHAALEFWHAGAWHSVPAPADAVVVNLGDIVQVWSNDRFHAPVHRVRASARQERMSMPFFLNPANSYRYAPVTDADAPRYRAIAWQEFREQRAAGDYADYGAEVQIADYRIAP
ncbi:MAG: 2OG-Fe(II) oxygenase family protein [Pseudomonadota bacterium]